MKFNKLIWLADIGRMDVSKEAVCCSTALFNHANMQGRSCYPSQDTLQNEGKLSDKGVRKALRELVSAGLLRITERGEGHEYELLMAPNWDVRTKPGYKLQRTKKAPRGGRRRVGDAAVHGKNAPRVGEDRLACGGSLRHRAGERYAPSEGRANISITDQEQTNNISDASLEGSGFWESASNLSAESFVRDKDTIYPDELSKFRETASGSVWTDYGGKGGVWIVPDPDGN